MYNPISISDAVYYVGVNDRRSPLFENQIPLPYGVSYNSYLVVDDKTALIDTVEIACFETFVKKIESIIADRPIDYLIINHMEPDHSGALRLIKSRYPQIRLVGNRRTKEMVEGYFGISDDFVEINESSVLDLGKRQLQFFLTPMVHWPETMMTYDSQHKILFSGDAFGCFGALNGGVTDEDLSLDIFWDEMRRYYACIVGKYGAPVQNALAKLQAIDIACLCPTHGPVWKKQIHDVMADYDRYSRYESESGVVIAYGSMYGNTEQMAEAIAEGLVSEGVKNVALYDVAKTDSSYILSDIFRYKGLIVGSPTYMNDILPAVDSLLRKIETRTVKNRVFASFGSCSWAAASVKRIAAIVESLQWETVGAVEEKHALKAEKYAECVSLGKKMAAAL
ncbi:MAG: FprA family A-type flavoprotein [Candidatus Symbiothrix sp.]|jgi:flavorubredoxin|nr:FprA family A-type flavoprotein [Candidatus Symbiothrix sp.]